METLAPSAPPHAESMPNPSRVMGMLMSFVDSAILKAAIDLDVFSAIAEGATSARALAQNCSTDERGMRILCDNLTVLGFLTKEGDIYGLTLDSAVFLNKQSPANLGSIANFLASDHIKNQFRDLAEVVRRGTSLNGDEAFEPENPMWVEFARSMAPMMGFPAHMTATVMLRDSHEPIKVLDIAAGHGLYGIALAQQNPNATVVGLDWKNVLELAKENAAKAGVANRYETIAGSAFEVDLGSGYDIVLIPNFLHHFDAQTNEGFLRKVRAALRPGGRAATVEFVPNEDRVSPPMPAGFSMMMLAGTPAGEAYTFSELERMFAHAGFASTTRHDLEPTPQTLLISTT